MTSAFTENSIVVYGLPGAVNPILYAELIAWFWESQGRKYKTKARITCYWLNLYDEFWLDLTRLQAYELMGLLASKTTPEQRKARIEWRKKNDAKWAQEFRKIHRDVKRWRERRKLILTYVRNVN